MKFGYQLSSAAPYLQTEKDLWESLRKLSRMGYQTVQLQGASYSIPNAVIDDAMNHYGLRCVAMQEDFPIGFHDEPTRAIQRAVDCGCRYLTFAKWPGIISCDAELEDYAEKIAGVQEQAEKAGLTLCFHPIGPDFQPIGGVPIYEMLLGLLPGVQLTFCVSGSFGSGLSVDEILGRFAGRVDLVHFKDFRTLPDGNRQLVPLGEGETDWSPIAAACQAAGVKYIFAEQEQWDRDAFDCAAASYNYLSTLKF